MCVASEHLWMGSMGVFPSIAGLGQPLGFRIATVYSKPPRKVFLALLRSRWVGSRSRIWQRQIPIRLCLEEVSAAMLGLIVRRRFLTPIIAIYA